jgi:hypothetical protein
MMEALSPGERRPEMRATVGPEVALEHLEVEHNAVRDLIATLTAAEMTRPDTIRYGLYPDQQCSFKDLLAHLITYEAYALEALDEWQQGQPHWISAAMQSPSESRAVHYGGIDDRRNHSLEAVLDEWENTQARLMQAIGELSPAEWQRPAPFDPHTDLGGMLEAILVAPPRPLYRHLPVHIPDVQAYIRSLR